MSYYYQYDTDGVISAWVKSDGIPQDRAQIVLDTPLHHSYKRFDSVTKEVIFYDRTYNEDTGDLIKMEENTTIPRRTIDDADILTRR